MKNSILLSFFRQIGRVEELGSGFQRLYKLCKTFAWYDPIISDENAFKFVLPINFYDKIVMSRLIV
ncbi:hypothetical protein ATZ36_09315 [Candidatus Endomicrobiellum trichonymphae]|uniref:ATP-dependent DNA helicase RecG C-terminal domain-containing protein n=1 Tax=Endomicrobium trichonymphae TaxID=1408204 RepID=A0A1E5IG56_ENDTX|nr:hypothetical protein ATZ36_09315 [Candidatus Endomicrobium trichonymphae]